MVNVKPPVSVLLTGGRERATIVYPITPSARSDSSSASAVVAASGFGRIAGGIMSIGIPAASMALTMDSVYALCPASASRRIVGIMYDWFSLNQSVSTPMLLRIVRIVFSTESRSPFMSSGIASRSSGFALRSWKTRVRSIPAPSTSAATTRGLSQLTEPSGRVRFLRLLLLLLMSLFSFV